jgi:endoglucanase
VYRDSPRVLENGILCGKAVDDRSGFVTIIQTLELLKGKPLNVDIVAVAAVQEEIGWRGIGPAAFAIEPDYSITVDVTHAHTPDSTGQTFCTLGAGPCLNIGPNTDRRFNRFLQNTAEAKGIPYQLITHNRNCDTNAFAVQTSRAGVVTASVEIPLRYMHSPVECITGTDLENAAKLIAAALLSMNGEGF